MLGSVVIPQKELIVDFSIQDVKNALSKLPKMISNCTLVDQNIVINKFDFNFTSLMSLGNKLSIHLVQIDENKTKLVIDTTRVVGTFNESHEVSSASTDYNKFTNALSKLLLNPNISETEIAQYNKTTDNSSVNFVLIIIFVIAMFYIFSR
jgi:hypothetical protein